ncbi:hypothetical protein M378DRAFT_554566 [Amanita muscaria Koide BX008]|uniref:Uncharacterized protein n=1 Tax=Amanita muscaria (strain Koide BX008) TaxID=946122 RepID=A0A0C2TDT2_AMAMK|nr:hypothetical protein M378DRAFT_554566 [Amanita muscaria Koide BX008]
MAVTFYAGIIIVIIVLIILGAILRQRRLRYTRTVAAPLVANRVVRVEYTSNNGYGQAGATPMPMPAPPPAYTRGPGPYPTYGQSWLPLLLPRPIDCAPMVASDQNHCPVCGMPGDLDHVNHSPPKYHSTS